MKESSVAVYSGSGELPLVDTLLAKILWSRASRFLVTTMCRECLAGTCPYRRQLLTPPQISRVFLSPRVSHFADGLHSTSRSLNLHALELPATYKGVCKSSTFTGAKGSGDSNPEEQSTKPLRRFEPVPSHSRRSWWTEWDSNP